ncbi:MAG: hypothetical protein HY906_27815 [Deltaproteobacteria bacterium]|nr:hypothetical protein [Deltaproteobacteria bacterium]
MRTARGGQPDQPPASRSGPRCASLAAGRGTAGLVLVALVLGAAGPVRGQPACAAKTRAWVAALERAVGVPTVPLSCQRDLVRVQLRPEHAEPLDVEIAEPPGPAFRRVGRLRVSPVLEVPDFDQVAAPRREAFGRLATWLATHQQEVVFGGSGTPAPVRRVLRPLGVRRAGPWLLLAALALVVASRVRARPLPRPDLLWSGGVGAAAAVLRLGLGAYGPLHVNGQGPLWLEGAISNPAAIANYGPGYAELYSIAARLAPSAPDHGVFVFNALLAALVPVLAFAFARLAGVGLVRAVAAAALLAIDPVAIRTAATESYVVAATTLPLLAAVAFLAAARHASGGERLRAALLVLAGALLGAQCARIHPSAWVPVALAPLAVLPSPDAGGWLARAKALAITAAALAVVVVATSGGVLVGVLDVITAGALPHPTPEPSAVVMGLALVAAVFLRPRPLALVAAVHLAALALTRGGYVLSFISLHGFDRVHLAIPVVALAGALPQAVFRRRALAAAVGGLLVAACGVLGWSVVPARTTDHLEYRWARTVVRELPAEARIVYVGVAGERVVHLPTYAGGRSRAARRVNAREVGDAAGAPPMAGNVWYARTSRCSSVEGRPACAALERRLRLEPVARAAFPALPSARHLPYDRQVVDVEIARVVPPQK